MAQENEIKKILYITMSNLGDAMMGLPAFDFLRRECPEAKITVVAGPRTRCVFENHPAVETLIVYDKNASLRQKIELFFRLKKGGFDAVLDLRNTFYRWGLTARYKNPALVRYPAWVVHSHQKHLFQAVVMLRGGVISRDEFCELNARRDPSFICVADRLSADRLLEESRIGAGEEFILVVPGARSDLKKWPKEGYAEVARQITAKYGYKVVLVGDRSEEPFLKGVMRGAEEKIAVLAGRTNFGQLCSLVLRAKMAICNDSGVLHIASYLEKPVVGIYGPSDYLEYGPWSKTGIAVRKSVLCAPCGSAHCRKGRECIETIRPYDVMLAVRLILEGDAGKTRTDKYRRILVARTDRIGDVLISTPVVKALRDHYPTSYIAMMVSIYTKDLVEGNPYLDRVIPFDKDKKDRGFLATLAFSKKLKDMDFDVAVILHPTVRVHLICFLAGIRERIGYDRKAPYFLTQAIPHKKQEGMRHEVEYNFDLLTPLGITEVQRELYMPIRESSESFVREILQEEGLRAENRIIAVNPAASCISRRWPLKKFAELIDRLGTFDGVRVALVADTVHRSIALELMRLTGQRPVDLSGRLNLSELASFLRRCALVISNDSGPVHLAVAVGTPVISIFGRNQPGLSPQRWGPLGAYDAVLHKKTQCNPCLAHGCLHDFRCLDAITVEEVLVHVGRLLGIPRQPKPGDRPAV